MSDQPESAEPGSFEDFQEAMIDGWAVPLLAYGKQTELAKQFNVSTRTIRDWKKRMDWTEVRKKAEIRKDFAGRQIDDALERRAISGDVRAIELWKMERDGFIPTTAQKQTVRDERVDVDSKLAEYEAKIRETLTGTNSGADAGLPKAQGDPGVSGSA